MKSSTEASRAWRKRTFYDKGLNARGKPRPITCDVRAVAIGPEAHYVTVAVDAKDIDGGALTKLASDGMLTLRVVKP